jgi:hypothetical protein
MQNHRHEQPLVPVVEVHRMTPGSTITRLVGGGCRQRDSF